MSNTHKRKKHPRRFKHIASFVAIHLGILLLMETDVAVVTASLVESGKGTFLEPAAITLESGPAQSVIKAADTVHGAAQDGIHTLIASQLVTGILLVTLGFFLHVLWISHQKAKEEQPVRVTVKKSKKKEPTWFWVEMRI